MGGDEAERCRAGRDPSVLRACHTPHPHPRRVPLLNSWPHGRSLQGRRGRRPSPLCAGTSSAHLRTLGPYTEADGSKCPL